MKGTGYGQYVKMAKRMAERARDRKPQYAVVRRVDGVRADLIVGQSQTVIRNAEVIGDTTQLKAGDTVQIAWWDGDRPVAIAGTRLNAINGRMADAERRLDAINITRTTSTPNNTGGISDWQILRFSKGSLASVHEPTAEGMQDAMSIAAAGDMVLLPSLEIAVDCEVPAGVSVTGLSRSSSIILGTITLNEKSSLDSLKVLDCEGGEGDTEVTEAAAVIVNGSCRINNCDVFGVCCQSEDACGVCVNAGTAHISQSFVSGESNGIGYGFRFEGGTARIYESTVYGTTAQYSDDSKAFVHGVSLGEAVSECPPPPDNRLLMSSSAFVRGSFNDFHFQFVNQWERGRTITATRMEHSELFSVAANESVYGVAISPNFAYFCIRNSATSQVKVQRYATGEVTGTPYLELNYDAGIPVYTLIDENISYVVVNTPSAGIKIVELDFLEETVTTKETVALDIGSTEFGSFQWLAHHRYGEKDYIVAVASISYATGTYREGARVIVYNVTDHVLVDDVVDELETIPSLFFSSNSMTPAVTYNQKVIFTVLTEPANNDDYGNTCCFPTFIVDVTNGDVQRVSNRKGMGSNMALRSGVDFETGIYYLWVDEWVGSSEEKHLLKIDLSNPVMLQDADTAYISSIFYGQNDIVALENIYVDASYMLRVVPELTLIEDLSPSYWDDQTLAIDDDNRVAWRLTHNGMRGIPLDGGTEKTVSFDWSAIPFQYNDVKRIHGLMIFNNVAIVCIHSQNYSPAESETTYYLLKEAA